MGNRANGEGVTGRGEQHRYRTTMVAVGRIHIESSASFARARFLGHWVELACRAVTNRSLPMRAANA
jgi:hypothetical protein